MMESDLTTILLVEDDDSLALVETKYLNTLSYNVIRASDGEAAIRIFKTNADIGLIFMDIDLGPGITGPDAAKAILKTKEIPIIFLSSHTELAMISYAEEISSYGYLHKSATISVYSSFIQKALRLFRVNQEIKRKNMVLSSKIKQFDILVDNTPAAIAVFDVNMNYLAVSKQFYRDYHLVETDIIGKSHYAVFPEISNKIKTIHKRCLRGEILSDQFTPFYRTNGVFDFVKWEMRPWHNENGEIGGVILFSIVLNKFIEEYKKYNKEVLMFDKPPIKK